MSDKKALTILWLLFLCSGPVSWGLCAQQDVSFIARREYPLRDHPVALVSGDLNNDSVVDLVIATDAVSPPYNLMVLLGRGDGTFQGTPELSFTGRPAQLFLSDLNGDDYLDLIILPGDSYSQVEIWFGRGDGRFSGSYRLPVGGTLTLQVGDFDGDDIPDLALAAYTGRQVAVYRGLGNGAFQPPQYTDLAGPQARLVAAADFNGDGILDLALMRSAGTSSLRLSTLLGRGDGTFDAAPDMEVGSLFMRIMAATVGDFNGDGRPDLVLYDGSILLGRGDGTFQRAPMSAAASGFSAVADFNNDSIQDLVVTNEQDNLVSVQMGRGDGTFDPPQRYQVGGGPNAIVVEDFNGDGWLDMAVKNFGSASVSLLQNVGGGRFPQAPEFAAGDRPSSLMAGDFNEDNALDLVVINNYGSGLTLLLGNGDGTFRPPQPLSSVRGVYAIALGDFDRDDHLDLALALADEPAGGIAVLLGHGDGTFRPPQTYTVGRRPYSITADDFNGDGILDLAVTSWDTDDVSVLLGNGDGTFGAARHFNAGRSPSSIVAADFNGDHIPDLAVTNSLADSISILLGQGDGTFAAGRSLSVGSSPGSLRVDDFNGDSKPDLTLVVSAGYGHNLILLLGLGDGSFQPPRFFEISSAYPPPITTGDFNGDGYTDAAVVRGLQGVSFLLGRADGLVRTVQSFGAGRASGGAAAGDFNGDGWLDLAVANGDANTITILLNNTPPP